MKADADLGYLESIRQFFTKIGAAYESEDFSCGVSIHMGRVGFTYISIVVNHALYETPENSPTPPSDVEHSEIVIRQPLDRADYPSGYKSFEIQVLKLANRFKNNPFSISEDDHNLIYKNGALTVDDFEMAYATFNTVLTMLNEWGEVPAPRAHLTPVQVT